ncbi:MAG: hypothetical protein N2111_05365 [Candidatus Sumerlaeaceae bacterium]|nr:hypothetical protein [Candidatus Sumerlaeaceae bacterium]
MAQRWLVVAVVLAGVLRLLPVGYGYPAPAAFSSDEVDAVSRALKLVSGDLMPLHASKPTFYNVCVAGALGGHYGAVRLFAGETRSDYERRFFLRPFSFYAAARLVSVAASLAALLLLLYSLRREGNGARLVAMLILGFAPATVHFGHVAKEDALAAFLVFGSFVAALEAWGAVDPDSANPPQRRFWWCLAASGLLAGLAVSTKYNCFFAPLFPLLVPLGRRGWRVRALSALTAVALVAAGFILGTPYAAVHPAAFLERSLGSAVAAQVTGQFGYVHNLGKSGPGFVAHLFWNEYGLTLGAIMWALALLLRRRAGIPAELVLIPFGTYLAALFVSGQLDYQYAILTTPVASYLFGRVFRLEVARRRGARLRGLVLLLLLVAVPWHLLRLTRATAEYFGGDTRLEAARWIEAETAAGRIAIDKPLLVAAPYYFRYHPDLAFTRATYERLLAEARAAGGEGEYFRRAAECAESAARLRFDADFLPITTAFRRASDGSRLFDPQRFPLEPDRYAGRYSVTVLPAYALRLMEPDLPELADLQSLLRAISPGEPLACFAPRPWRLAGPEIRIYHAP